jgi:two-component system OmpR family sensor kinase
MNKYSILLRIIIFFFLALVATTALFKVMYTHEFRGERERLRIHYHHIAMNVMRWRIEETTYSQLVTTLAKDKMVIVDDLKLYNDIQKREKFDTVSCAKGDFHLYEQDTFRYVIVPPEVGELLLKDINTKDINVDYVWWLYAAFIIMMLLFLSIAISLYPLKHLQSQIHRFGEGDIDVDFSSTRKDEIGEVANEFNNSAKKIKDILQARIIFLRNITHELKTPITSGKLALEFIDDSKSKDVLHNVFTKLELLLKEFVHIEQITATDQKLEKKSYILTDILDQACDLLFIESSSIKNNFSDKKLEVNFELFSIIFKNLIDNAIKYSKDNNFYIECKEDGIYFCSSAEPMDETLEYYLQPFTKVNENSPESFGLGLYIINALLKKHNFTLEYNYKDGYNCFIIKP